MIVIIFYFHLRFGLFIIYFTNHKNIITLLMEYTAHFNVPIWLFTTQKFFFALNSVRQSYMFLSKSDVCHLFLDLIYLSKLFLVQFTLELQKHAQICKLQQSVNNLKASIYDISATLTSQIVKCIIYNLYISRFSSFFRMCKI